MCLNLTQILKKKTLIDDVIVLSRSYSLSRRNRADISLSIEV